MLKTIVKPIGSDKNLHKLGLFLPYGILAYKDGRQFDFSIEVRDLEGRPNCKIGNFANNVWCRTRPALNTNWNGYKSYSELSKAVKLSLRKRGFEVLGWYKR